MCPGRLRRPVSGRCPLTYPGFFDRFIERTYPLPGGRGVDGQGKGNGGFFQALFMSFLARKVIVKGGGYAAADKRGGP